VDISAAAIELARALVPNREHARCAWHVGDVTRLPFEDATFDAVVERSVLIYVEDKPAAVAEFHRVLKDGGRLSLFEPVNSGGEDRWLFDLEPIHVLHERVQRRRRRLHRVCGPMLDFDSDSLVRMFKDRFRTVDAQREQWVWSPGSGDEWLRSLDQQPNPLWPSQREIITQALGPAAESYLAYMLHGVQTAGYEYRCPTVFVVASK
jgi:SAM-dependent methyltransferase